MTDLSSLIADEAGDQFLNDYITERRSKKLVHWIPITLALVLIILALGPLAYLFLVHPERLTGLYWSGLMPDTS